MRSFVSTSKKLAGAGVLALGLAVLPSAMPAAATTTPGTGTTTTPGTITPGTTTTPGITATQPTQAEVDALNQRVTELENDTDWGWLGLIGLAGLFGLAGRNKRDEPVRYQEPTVTTRPGYRE